MAGHVYILGVDYGARRVGLAVAHIVAKLPRPLTTLTNDESLIAHIKDMVDKEDIGLVIVGVPRSMDGSETVQSGVCEAFAAKLSENLSVEVKTVDETLSSVEAEAYLTDSTKVYNKEEIDAVAAAVILERYFEEYTGEGNERSLS